ncbi:MAG: hypothetical protein ACXVP0_03120 [Bacteroidia bacterium]
MTSDKAFEQLKLAALEVKALLIDIDENIHPPVTEMESLQEKLNVLSEKIAVYKFIEGEKELAPNLSLHLKVMEKAIEKEEKTALAGEMEIAEKIAKTEAIVADVKAELQPEVKKLEFSLNDKFRIINELFKQSTTEFNLAVEQLNSFMNLDNSQMYLNELKNLYGWKDDHELTRKVYQANQKRFQ